MDQISNLKIKLEAETAKFTEQINKARNSLNGLSGTTGGINLTKLAIGGLAAAALAAAGAFAAFYAAGQEGIKFYAETERYLARTDAQLKATGAAVGFTSGEMDQFARSVAMNTLASTDGVRSAMSVMMTYRSVTGETFKSAIKLSQDMAEVFRTDISSEARNLGRALESPAEAVTLLKRKGIELTSSQQELIKSFVESGQKAKAQEIILHELQKRVGGAGEAVAKDTVAGALDTLGQVTEELKEEFAKTTGITDLFKDSVNKLSGALQWLTKVMKGVDTKTHVDNLEKQIDVLEKSKKSLEEKAKSGIYGDGLSDALAHTTKELEKARENLAKSRKELEAQEAAALKQQKEADEARKKHEQQERETAGQSTLDKIEDRLKSRSDKLTAQYEKDKKALENLVLSEEEIRRRGFENIDALRQASLNKLTQNYNKELAEITKGETKKSAVKSAAKTNDLAKLDMTYADELQKISLAHQERINKIKQMAITEKDAKERGFASALELRKHYLELENQAYDQAIDKQKDKMRKEDFDKSEKVRSFFNEVRGSGNDEYVQNDITRENQLVKAQELYDQQLLSVQQFEEAKALIEDQYRKRKEDLDRQAAANQLNIASQLFDGIAGIIEAAGAKNSAAYRTIFAISKSFQIEESMLNLHAAVIKALNDRTAITPAQKFANMAAVASKGAAVLQQLTSVTLSGARANGGPVGGGRAYLVGERGPEIFVPGASGQITSNENLNKALGGGGSGNSVIINQTNNFDGNGGDDHKLARMVAEVTRRQVYDVLRTESRAGGSMAR
ncbi:phage tail length tape measure family protein [Aggregatibacter actinomycetemcomitans]|uniref:phage tail length tape measure family protein n=1 Tax=Aggregatibacter actinomycetemcomitans TaxID=714 RepID=UPI002151A570|nr:phage tail length tape measure family protein [Aggregatibacter actinomycetemcomitans]